MVGAIVGASEGLRLGARDSDGETEGAEEMLGGADGAKDAVGAELIVGPADGAFSPCIRYAKNAPEMNSCAPPSSFSPASAKEMGKHRYHKVNATNLDDLPYFMVTFIVKCSLIVG